LAFFLPFSELKIGYQYFIKRFSFDVYAGLGARYKDVHYFYETEPNIFSDYFRIEDREGKYWRFIVPVSFKIGWVL